MAHSVETNKMQCVFVETNLETRLGLLLQNNDDVFTIKGKICREHVQCFPSYGDITVSALKVNRNGQFYKLADSLVLTKAFEGNDKFIHVDVLCVDAKGQAATSNPTINDGLTQNPHVAEKESEKRKSKSSLNDQRSRKKPVGLESNLKLDQDLTGPMKQDLKVGVALAAATVDLVGNDQEKDRAPTPELVENVNKIQEHESLSGATVNENEMGNKEDGEKEADEAKSVKAKNKPKSKSAKIVVVEDTLVAPGALNVQAENVLKEENGMGTEDNGEKDADGATPVKGRKKSRSKIVKTVKEDTVAASGAQNVEVHNVVKDSEGIVEKVVNKSSKRVKKTQVVEEA